MRSEIESVNARARQSGSTAKGNGLSALPRMNAVMAWTPQKAKSTPSAPPASESVTLSVSSWRTIVQRPAPNGQANRHFFLPGRSARQQQAGNVRASNQKHKADGAHQNVERLGEKYALAGEPLLSRNEENSRVVGFLRERLRPVQHLVAKNQSGRRLRLPKGNARFETGNDDQPPVVRASAILSPSDIQARKHGKREEKVLRLSGGKPGKAGLCDAHDRERHAV